MIYKKLPVILLSVIASNKKGTTNSIIAEYFLQHLEEVKHLGISELSSQIGVAKSSISRFCKEIGFNDFNELKEATQSNQQHFEKEDNISKRIIDSFKAVDDSIDFKQLKKLVQDLHHYNKIAAFGLLKAEGVAISLQTDLLMQNKYVYTNLSYKEQLEYLLNASSDDLIIIFSYTGAYFDYKDLRSSVKKLDAPKIWMISGEKIELAYVNEYIYFSSSHIQITHPYQLQYIENLIAQSYQTEYNKKR